MVIVDIMSEIIIKRRDYKIWQESIMNSQACWPCNFVNSGFDDIGFEDFILQLKTKMYLPIQLSEAALQRIKFIKISTKNVKHCWA